MILRKNFPEDHDSISQALIDLGNIANYQSHDFFVTLCLFFAKLIN